MEEKVTSRRESLKAIKYMKKEATTRFHETGDTIRFEDDVRKLGRLQREAERDPNDLFKIFLEGARKTKEVYEFLTSQKAQAPVLTDEELANRYAWFCFSQGRYPLAVELRDATGWELTEIGTWLDI